MLRINNNNKVLILSLTFSNNTYFLLHPPCDGINLSSQPVLCGPALKQLLERLSTSSRMTAHLDPEYSIPSRSTPFSRKLQPATSSHHFTTGHISQWAHSFTGAPNVASGMHCQQRSLIFCLRGTYTPNTQITQI